MSFFYGFVRVICIIVTRLIFRIELSGTEYLKKGTAYVLCCNHQSFWDMPLLIAACPFQIFFMAKKEIFKFKLFNIVLNGLGIFPVSRGEGDLAAIKKSNSLIKNGRVLGIFPQGTRKPMSPPSKLKAGAALVAFQTKAPVLPAAINYCGKIKIFGRVRLNFGEPILCEGYMGEDENIIDRKSLKELTNTISDNLVKLWEK